MGPQQQFKRDRPCPVCGGHADAPQGERHRCYGYLSDDGRYAHCTRAEHAGRLGWNGNSDTVAHYLEGHRRCGVPHVEHATARPLPGGSRNTPSAWSYRDHRSGHPSQLRPYRHADGELTGTVVVLTANQSSPTGEIARRSVRIRLLRRTPDSATYVPSEGWRHRLPFAARTFRGVLEAMILEWIAQDCPRGDYQHSTAPDWAQIVGGILDVAGIPGFLANAEALRGTVTGADALVPALVIHWWATVEDRPLVAAAVREWFDAESVEQPWKLDDATPQGRGRQISEEMVKLVGRRHWLQDGRQVEVVTAERRVDGKPKRAWRLVLVDDGEAPPPAPRTPLQNAEELRQRLEDG